MFATLGVLIVGVAGFYKGGEFNKRYGNRLMQARVALQAVTLGLLFIMFMTSG